MGLGRDSLPNCFGNGQLIHGGLALPTSNFFLVAWTDLYVAGLKKPTTRRCCSRTSSRELSLTQPRRETWGTRRQCRELTLKSGCSVDKHILPFSSSSAAAAAFSASVRALRWSDLNPRSCKSSRHHLLLAVHILYHAKSWPAFLLRIL